MSDSLQRTTPDSTARAKPGSQDGDITRPDRTRSYGVVYGVAMTVVLLATLLRIALSPVLGRTGIPYMTYFPAIVVSAWIGGVRPGLLSVVLSAFIGNFLFVLPAFSLAVSRPTDSWALLTFVLAGSSIAAMGEAQRRVRLRAEQSARDARQEARQRQFLTEASEVLASSLEYEQTLQRVADLAVPHIADWCGVEMLEADGSIHQLAVAHVNPEKIKWAREFRELYPPDLSAARGLANVLRTGRPEVMSHLPDELLVAGARDARHLQMIRAIGLDSFMIVPIIARERVLGAISFVATDESAHHYTEADLQLAEGLAARAALAIDNARLYREAQQELAERRRVQDALRASEEQFRFALANSDISVYTMDRELRYTWVYSGRASAELTAVYGKTDEEFLIREDALALMEIKRRVLETGIEERHVARATYKGQPERYFDTLFAPLRSASREITGVTGTVNDITEHKKAQDALARHQAEIEALNVRLLRSMRETHHRVKNNLQVVTALVDMQQMQYEDLVPIAELKRLTQHIMSLAAIHDLLTHQAQIDGEATEISVRDVMQKLLPSVQGMVEGRDVSFQIEEVRLPVRHSTTLAVLVNELVSNALKHGKGAIEVYFHIDADIATLEVLDQGSGFPADFDPVAAANTGLDLIDALAQMDLRGSIRFETRAGGGARVVIEFPVPALAATPGES